MPPTPVGDPEAAVLVDPVVPEHRRVCATCHQPVGRGHGGAPGRTEGFCVACGTRFDFRPALASGDLVGGQYQVVGCLAHGGMGWIYLARDRNVSDRWVVLKGLLNSGDPDTVTAAIAERRFLAQVEHPAIVQIYNFVTHDDASYIVMEHVGGKSLKQILAERRQAAGRVDPLPVDHALAYVLEVLPALGYLHERGLLYCDLKPANLISHGESVKLIDLGGVRRVGDEVSALFGTVGFQAPEVPVDGPSVASEIFTVGRTLATLVLDFRGNTTTYATRLPPVGEHPVLTRYDSFYRLLAKACAPDPDDRFVSVDELRVQMLGVLRQAVAIDRGLGKPARGTATSLLFGSLTVDVADRPLRAAELPQLRADEHDPMRLWLAGLADDPRERLAALAKAPQVTPEVLIAQAYAVLAVHGGEDRLRPHDPPAGRAWTDQARQAAERLADLDPWDWRAVWLSGLVSLDQGDVLAARAAFNAVYGQVPGELAPQLALALTCEITGEVDLAEALYLVCAATDAAYTSPAAFGLARIRAGRGDTDGAVSALDLVSPTRASYAEAQNLRARLLADTVTGAAPGEPSGRRFASRRRERRPRDIHQVTMLAESDGRMVESSPERPRSLGELVEYQTRSPSTFGAVDAVCERIAASADLSDARQRVAGSARRLVGEVVRLSGIDWRVIDVTADGPGSQVLLLADQVIGTGPYQLQGEVTWSESYLRRWLNDEFIASLGVPLSSRVLEVAVHTGPNPIWETGSGQSTVDRVFLLSMEEAALLLAGEQRVEWKKHKGGGYFHGEELVARSEDKGWTTWWWLRSPGGNPSSATYVTAGGSINDFGSSAGSSGGGLRPALWLRV